MRWLELAHIQMGAQVEPESALTTEFTAVSDSGSPSGHRHAVTADEQKLAA